ncbi:MAG TPA: hypothetical protein VJ828_14340 [Lacipirellulaceae bacterium]|nr:hypothetical protein [Lacipirellulaceae bacterium]
MITSGIYSAFGLALVAMAFAAIAYARGPRFAFFAICWLPLAALLLVVGAHHHLGYAMIGVLMAILVASMGILALGVYLWAKTAREGRASYSLIAGIFMAALPLLVLLARW